MEWLWGYSYCGTGLRNYCFLGATLSILGFLSRAADWPLMSINNLWGLSHGARLTAASAARPSSLATNRNGPWPMWPGKALTLSPEVVPDEEVITTQGWQKKNKKREKNQWCLEGIKEWENRIQLASWSPRRITSSAHCFQMPYIFPCAASFQPHHWRGSRFQHPYTTRSLKKTTRKSRGNKEMWQPKKRSETVLGLIWNARGSLGSMEPCHIGKLKSNQTSSHCMLLQTLSMRDHFPPLLRLCDLSVLYYTNCSWLSNPFLFLKLIIPLMEIFLESHVEHFIDVEAFYIHSSFWKVMGNQN